MGASRFWVYALSLCVFVICTISIYVQGWNYGIDFRGGVLVEFRIEEEDIRDISAIRGIMSEHFSSEFHVQSIGNNDFVIKAAFSDNQDSSAVVDNIKNILSKYISTDVSYRKIDAVGAQIGEELILKAMWAVLFGLLAITLYLWVRFDWQYGVGATLSLIYDTLMTFCFLGIFNMELNLYTVASILTIIGYSVNDSVVIYDRIRENRQTI